MPEHTLKKMYNMVCPKITFEEFSTFVMAIYGYGMANQDIDDDDLDDWETIECIAKSW